ncbi:MAG: Ig-like domain-containing protein [Bacteroides sp.]|nr:Ig-like domain-containing protein [Bacteroides sp.]
MNKIFTLMLLCATVLFASCKDDDDPAPVAVSSVSLNKATLSIVAGTTETLTATIAPDNAADKAVSWQSSNTAAATVNEDGVVTAVAAGTTTITVTTHDGAKTDVCAVTVTNAPVAVTDVTLNKTILSLGIGDTETLAATVAPADATNPSVAWSTSDAAVATVADGVVTAVAAGTATITVTTTDGNKTAVCAVTVSDAPKLLMLGAKNEKFAFYDGTEIKYISGAPQVYKGILSSVELDGSIYGLLSTNNIMVKDDAVYTGDKVPQGASSINKLFAAGGSLYACGKGTDGKLACWKDGQRVVSVDINASFAKFCVLGSDIFSTCSIYDAENRINTYYVYKNNVSIFSTTSMSVVDILVNDGKVYVVLRDDKYYGYVYDGTTMTPDASADWKPIILWGCSGNTIYFVENDDAKRNVYKGTAWDTSQSKIEAPAGASLIMSSVVVQGDDVYTYGRYKMTGTDIFEGYGWKNGKDPFRLPMDTVNYVFHK